MGHLKKSMPEDCFQGKQWKHTPEIYECFSCGARGVSGFINTGFGYVCEKKACREKLKLKPVED